MTCIPDMKDELACARLMVAAVYYGDLHKTEEFIALFTADGSVSRLGDLFTGHDAIRTFLAGRKRDRRTRHVVATPIIEFSSPDTGSGIALFTLFDGIEDGSDVLPVSLPATVGEFRQSYRKIGGIWKIASHASMGVFRRI